MMERKRMNEKRKDETMREYEERLVGKTTLADKELYAYRKDLVVKFQGKWYPAYVLMEWLLKIVDKNGRSIPFHLNRSQIALYKEICLQRRMGKPVRQNILKSRQIGFSTFIAGLFFILGMFTPNMRIAVVADLKEHAQNIFAKYEYFYDHLDDNNPHKAEIDTYARLNKGRLHKESYKPALRARRGQSFLQTEHGNSIIEVLVAGESSGRSTTYDCLHLTEVGFFTNLRMTMNGLLETVSSHNLNSMIFLETTANGFNEYKERWDKDVIGKTSYNAFFVPWFANPEYADIEYTTFPDKELPLFEEWFYEKIEAHPELTKAQIMWYWRKYLDKADKGMTLQEYPFTPTDAFLTSGDCYFGAELVAKRKEQVLREYQAGGVITGLFTYEPNYSLDGSQIELKKDDFVVVRNGAIHIFEKPIDRHPYVVVCDPNNSGSDYSAIQVVDNYTGKQVARFMSNEMDLDGVAFQLYLLGKMYNWALISSERNTGVVVLEYLVRLKYPHIYIDSKAVFEDYTQKNTKRFGHRTEKNNRDMMLELFKVAFRENPNFINDYDTLCQMETFQRVQRRNARGDVSFKEMAVGDNKDDLVMAMAGYFIVREQQTALFLPESAIPKDNKIKTLEQLEAFIDNRNRERYGKESSNKVKNSYERFTGIKF